MESSLKWHMIQVSVFNIPMLKYFLLGFYLLTDEIIHWLREQQSKINHVISN